MTYSLKKPILLLHNGNSRVKNLIATKFGMEVANCVVDIPNKVDFFKNNPNVVVDLTCADEINDHDLYELSKCCHIVKAITSYEDDLENLEPVYTDYSYDQWMRATMKRMWASTDIIWIGNWRVESDTSQPKITFTAGRTGTHVLTSIVKTAEFVHNQTYTLSKPDLIKKLFGAEHIYTVYRKSFFNLLCSMMIGTKIDYASPTEETIDEVKQLINSVEPFELTKTDFNTVLGGILNFTDMLLFLKIVQEKSISLTFYEELSDYYDKISFKKNPYKYENLISNFDDSKKIIEENYQPIFQYALDRAIRHCGKTLL